MPKTYLRYVPQGMHGVIASPAAPFAVDPTGSLIFTAQLENVGVWHAKRGVEVSSSSTAASSACCALVFSFVVSLLCPLLRRADSSLVAREHRDWRLQREA